MGTIHCSGANHLHAITRQLFIAKDTPAHIADEVVEVMVNSNLAAHDSHGVRFLPSYLDRIDSRVTIPAAGPKVIEETANTLLCDSNHGFGHYATQRATA